MKDFIDDIIKVLIVDDEQPILTISTKILSKLNNIEIKTAKDSKEAIQISRYYDPDVIFSFYALVGSNWSTQGHDC